MQTAIDYVCVEEFAHDVVGAEVELHDKKGLDALCSVLQGNLSAPYPDHCYRSEESSDADYGLGALRANLSAQSPALQLMPSKRRHVCWECSERFKTLHDLMEHFQQHQAAGRCHLCQVTFRRGTSLAIHLENAHRDEPLMCPVKSCKAQLQNMWHLNQHMEMCHVGESQTAKVVEEEEEVVEEEQLPKEGQWAVPEQDLQEHIVSDHSYHRSVNMSQIRTDHTYNCRSNMPDHTASSMSPQYVLSSAPENAQCTDAHRTMVEMRSGQCGTSPVFDIGYGVKAEHTKPSITRVNQKRLQSVAPSNTAQGHVNMSANQRTLKVGNEHFLEECAPVQWDEDEELAVEEVVEEDGSTDSDEEVKEIDDENYDDDDDNEDDDSDSGSDSLPPGDSLYVPDKYLNSDSNSNSDSHLDSESFSSDSSDSHTRSGKRMRCRGKKTAKRGVVVKLLSSEPTSTTWQKCPHCGLGPYRDLKPHMVKCCSKGPENCIKCWRVYGRDMDYICVDCKKTFSGFGSCKTHVCPVNANTITAVPAFSAKKKPVKPALVKTSDLVTVPVATQASQFYQIVSLLPPGVIYTQAPSTSTKTAFAPSASAAILHNSAAMKVISTANPLLVQDARQVSPLVMSASPGLSSPPTPAGSVPVGVVGSFVAKSKETPGKLVVPGNDSVAIPTPQTVTVSNPVTSALKQTTVVTSGQTTASAQVANQTVQSNAVFKPPGPPAPSFIHIAKPPQNLVHVYTHNPPNTQVFVKGQTPSSTPSPSATPAPLLVCSQVPAGMPVNTITNSQRPSTPVVTVVCNQDQLRMPTAMVIGNHTPAGMPGFTVVPSQAQPTAPTAVVVHSPSTLGVPAPITNHTQAPSGVAASSAGCTEARPGVSTSTATVRGMQPSLPTLLRLPTQSPNMFLIPMHSQPLGAVRPSVGHLICGTPGVLPTGLFSVRVPAPPSLSPQVSLSSTVGHVSNQVSTTVSTQVSVSKTVSTSSVLPATGVRPQVSVSSTPPSSQTSSSLAVTAPAPIQAPNSTPCITRQRTLSAASTQSRVDASQSGTGSSVVPPSDSGPLSILFMFLNQSRELALARRMKTRWHYKEVFTCRQCGAISRQPSLVVVHRYRHRGAPRHHRCQCGRWFQARLYLLRHQMLHAEATRYICSPCGDSFEGARQLVRHKANCRQMRKISSCAKGWRPFVCTCGLRFVRSSALLWHKLNNSKSKGKARKPKSLCQNQYDVPNAPPAT